MSMTKEIREGNISKTTDVTTRYLVAAAMLSAVSVVLQYIEFSIPIMPSFIKLDLSDLPSLIGSFAMGPVWGVAIAGIKNLIHLLVSQSGGIGELANFLLNAVFVATAGHPLQAPSDEEGGAHRILGRRSRHGAAQRACQLFYRVSVLYRVHADGSNHQGLSGYLPGGSGRQSAPVPAGV